MKVHNDITLNQWHFYNRNETITLTIDEKIYTFSTNNNAAIREWLE